MSQYLQGIFHDMPNEQYHRNIAAGSSGLKLLDQSPRHYWQQYINPDREHDDESTPAQKLGKATHTAILEPAAFDDRYTVMPDDLDRRTNAGKQVWAEILESGKEPLKQSQWDQIVGMSTAVHAHPVMKTIMGCNPLFETSMFWLDADTGAPCKIRPDLCIMPCKAFPNGLIVDVKTTGDASPAEFGRMAWNWDMHLQSALYTDGFQTIVGTDQPPPFLWLAVEKEAPFACAFYRAPPDLLDYGAGEVARLLDIFMQCMTADWWPAYETTIQDLQLPTWALRTIEGSQEVTISHVSE